jgi:hypothetical protein
MQQNPLIRFGDVQQITDFGAAHTLEVAECHDIPLLDRKFVERGPDRRRQLSGMKSLV